MWTEITKEEFYEIKRSYGTMLDGLVDWGLDVVTTIYKEDLTYSNILKHTFQDSFDEEFEYPPFETYYKWEK